MTTFHPWSDGRFISFTKGASDVLIDKTGSMLSEQGVVAIDWEEISGTNERMAAGGLRVLGIAMRIWNALPDDMSVSNVESHLTLLGLTGMMDPPREEAREAVSLSADRRESIPS